MATLQEACMVGNIFKSKMWAGKVRQGRGSFLLPHWGPWDKGGLDSMLGMTDTLISHRNIIMRKRGRCHEGWSV